MTEKELKALLMTLTPQDLVGLAGSGAQKPFIDEGKMRLFARGGDVSAAAKHIYDYIDSGADPVTAAAEFVDAQPQLFPNMDPAMVSDIADTVAKSASGMAKYKADMPSSADQLDKLGLGSLAPLMQYTQKNGSKTFESPTSMQDTYTSMLGNNAKEVERLQNLLFKESKSSKSKDYKNKAIGMSLGNVLGPFGSIVGLSLGNKTAGKAKNEYGYTKKEFEAGRSKKLKDIESSNANAMAAIEAEQRKAMARQQLYQDTYDTELAKYKVPSEFDIRKSIMLKALNG